LFPPVASEKSLSAGQASYLAAAPLGGRFGLKLRFISFDQSGNGQFLGGERVPDVERLGAIAQILVVEGLVDEKQVRHAQRVGAKLRPPRPLLKLLQELGYVSEKQIHEALGQRRSDVRIGELLLELGLVTEADLQAALDLQQEDPSAKKRLGDILLEHHFVEERRFYEALACQLGYPFVEPQFADIDPQLLAETPRKWCETHHFLPLGQEAGKVLVAFADCLSETDVQAARRVFGADALEVAVATPSSIDEAWEAIDRRQSNADQQRAHAKGDEHEVVGLVDQMLADAVAQDCSDIHAEPTQDRYRIRFREDGVLLPYRDLPLELANAFTSRLKVLCRANIAEHRRHQGGRMAWESDEQSLDLRVSFYVTVHGEKTVLRLLNRKRSLLSIEEIGMASVIRERFIEGALERPSGVILVTGPTGSGKTSTLYSCIEHIQSPEIAIITAEDPVEYMIDGIAQCSLNPEIDLGYEETLRHIVRQDPDVIVIGEIRDQFSAETAIQAALTGHKVITTFHTEDTIGGLLRLLNMNIEAFLISSTVVSVVAQRLLRRVCEECAVAYEPTPADIRGLGYSGQGLRSAEMRIGRGCKTCRHTGYKGRIAIFELLLLNEPVRDAILGHKTSQEIRRISRKTSGMVSLFEDGIVKVARGLTTVHEIVRMLPRLDHPRPLPELLRLVGE